MGENKNKIIEVQNLSLKIDGKKLTALENISFDLFENEIIALMGPSGSGKTSLALAMMGLLPPSWSQQGHIHFMNPGWVRGKDYGIIFQNPSTTLNPFFTIESQLSEVLRAHLSLPKRGMRSFLIKRLEEVELPNPERILRAYPSTLSGGEQQRVLIAMALLTGPSFIIADEPCASLDFSLKVKIVKLLMKLKETRGLSILWITHDELIAKRVADRMIKIGPTHRRLKWPDRPKASAPLSHPK